MAATAARDRTLILDGEYTPPDALRVDDTHAIANEAHRQLSLYDQALGDELRWTRTLAEAKEDLSLAKTRPWTALGPGGSVLVDGKNAETREAQARQALENDPTYVRARKAVWDAEREVADAQRRARIADRTYDLQMQLLRVLQGWSKDS